MRVPSQSKRTPCTGKWPLRLVTHGEYQKSRGARWQRKGSAEETAWNAVIAVELKVVERSGNAIPVGSGGALHAADLSFGSDDDIAAAHGAADEDNFEFDGRADGDGLRAKKIHAGGADVACDKGDGKFLEDGVNAAQAERQLE